MNSCAMSNFSQGWSRRRDLYGSGLSGRPSAVLPPYVKSLPGSGNPFDAQSSSTVARYGDEVCVKRAARFYGAVLLYISGVTSPLSRTRPLVPRFERPPKVCGLSQRSDACEPAKDACLRVVRSLRSPVSEVPPSSPVVHLPTGSPLVESGSAETKSIASHAKQSANRAQHGSCQAR